MHRLYRILVGKPEAKRPLDISRHDVGDNELLGSIKGEEFHYQLSGYRILKDSAAWTGRII
jgi:hypothetical protein